MEIYPRQDIVISAVAVGQLGGTVPSTVLSIISYKNSAAASLAWCPERCPTAFGNLR